MTIIGINHVQLAMPRGQEATARKFYGELLGLPEKEKPAHLALRGGLWFERDNLRVHLGVEESFRPARKAHPGFEVRGLPALVQRLQAAGKRIVDDEPIAGYERVFVDDPFGNRIELLEPSAPTALDANR